MHTIPTAGRDVPVPNCNPDELRQILAVLCRCTSPDEIVYFGSLAGAPPFSEVAAYDLAILTEHRTPDEWETVGRQLRLQLPARNRAIPFVNFYLLSTREARKSLFYRFVRSEGRVVFAADPLPPLPCDPDKVLRTATRLGRHYLTRARGMFDAAAQALAATDLRQAAFCNACTMELLLDALYAVYHLELCPLHRLPDLFLRLQTISAELHLLLDPERAGVSRMLARMEGFRRLALHDPDCPVLRDEVTHYFDRTRTIRTRIELLCAERMALYEERAGKSGRDNPPSEPECRIRTAADSPAAGFSARTADAGADDLSVRHGRMANGTPANPVVRRADADTSPSPYAKTDAGPVRCRRTDTRAYGRPVRHTETTATGSSVRHGDAEAATPLPLGQATTDACVRPDPANTGTGPRGVFLRPDEADPDPDGGLTAAARHAAAFPAAVCGECNPCGGTRE